MTFRAQVHQEIIIKLIIINSEGSLLSSVVPIRLLCVGTSPLNSLCNTPVWTGLHRVWTKAATTLSKQQSTLQKFIHVFGLSNCSKVFRKSLTDTSVTTCYKVQVVTINECATNICVPTHTDWKTFLVYLNVCITPWTYHYIPRKHYGWQFIIMESIKDSKKALM